MSDPAKPLEGIVRLALERVLAREERCGPGAGTGSGTHAGTGTGTGTETVGEWSPARGKGEVFLGSDHGGFELKQDLVGWLRGAGWRVRDVGTGSTEAVDYPDFALKVAAAVARGEAWRGIMVDGIGIGSSMAANKVPGVRAAVCFDAASTKNAREHNDANVMCIGGKVLDAAKGRELARVFLETDFGGDRHKRRVDKIVEIERMFLLAGAKLA